MNGKGGKVKVRRLTECHPSRGRAFLPSGLTLVEMLVATAVTLLLVLAVTQAFAIVSVIISNSRASIEMAGQLRGTAIRLQQDLDGLSAPVEPWLESASGLGYFEYIEGPGTDSRPRMYQTGVVTPAPLPTVSHLGDVDDIVMFTAHGGDEPFVGTYWAPNPTTPNGLPTVQTTLSANTAEVVWWSMLNDTNRNDVWDLGETFTLYRRVLLVKPELNHPDTGLLPIDLTRYPATPLGLNNFYNHNDLSVRPVLDPDTGAWIGYTANSLSDLTLRENRFAHYPVNVAGGTPSFAAFRIQSSGQSIQDPSFYPFLIDLRPASPTCLFNLAHWGANRGLDNRWGNAGQDDDNDGFTDNASEALTPGTDDLGDVQIGHDVMLPNVISFDVRAYDVLAPVNAYPGEDGLWGVGLVDDDNANGTDDLGEAGWSGSDDLALTPGDPGWVFDPTTVVGRGAYVDLNYLACPPRIVPQAFRPLSQFSEIPSFPPFLPFADVNNNGLCDPGEEIPVPYDTWPIDYERDGLNQNANGLTGAQRMDGVPDLLQGLVDEGTNGINDDGKGGVDDLLERETRPPYAARLRGIEITIRIIDPDTRQVRQQKVRSDFTRE